MYFYLKIFLYKGFYHTLLMEEAGITSITAHLLIFPSELHNSQLKKRKKK